MSHSTFAPSDSSAWMVCHGKINATWDIPESSSEYADEGSFFHVIASRALMQDRPASDFLGVSFPVNGNWFTFDDEMAGHMQPGLDWINEQRGVLHVERWVDGTKWLGLDPKTGKLQGGMLDVGLYNSELITIFDWKYGAGVRVSAAHNTQLMLYALFYWWNIARHRTNARDFRLVVWQPRVSGGTDNIWRCDLEELLLFGRDVIDAVEKANGPSPELVPGHRQCYWCKRKEDPRRCSAYDAFNLKLLQLKLRDLDSDQPPSLPTEKGITPERRAYLLKHKQMITEFLERLHADALDDAMAGRPTPGQKAVRGDRPNRQWADPDLIERVLRNRVGEEAYTRKILSPAQLERIEGKKTVERMSTLFEVIGRPLIAQGEGKPVLVDESDKRPAIEPPINRLPPNGKGD
jgi:hypothetical protein